MTPKTVATFIESEPPRVAAFRCGAYHAARARTHRAAGLSLAELILALAGMALVGAAVAVMINATAYGTDSRRDMRGVVVREKTMTSRVNAAIRSSKMVLAQGTDYVVLWMFDTTGDELPNLSEIRMIERKSVTSELYSYKAPANLAPAADTSYELTINFKTTLDAIKGGSTFPGERWGSNVSTWGITLNNATAQSATLVSYRLTITASTISDTAIGASALRNE